MTKRHRLSGALDGFLLKKDLGPRMRLRKATALIRAVALTALSLPLLTGCFAVVLLVARAGPWLIGAALFAQFCAWFGAFALLYAQQFLNNVGPCGWIDYLFWLPWFSYSV